MSGGNKTLNSGKLPVVDQLTPSEARIYALLLDKKSHADIAQELGMLVSSVKRRITTINEKVRTR